jgi:hypothetical protein
MMPPFSFDANDAVARSISAASWTPTAVTSTPNRGAASLIAFHIA